MRFRGPALGAIFVGAALVVVACVGDDPNLDTASTDAGDGGGGTTNDVVTAPTDTGTPAKEDGSATEDAGDAGAKRYCDTATKPLVGEFFCADFDGTDVKENWSDSFRPDGGTLDFTTDAFLSAPHALTTNPVHGTGNGSGPMLQWKSNGGKSFVSAEILARVNPTSTGGIVQYTGEIKLLEIKTDNALVALYITSGGNLADDDLTNDYVGYFIKSSAFGGAAAQHDYKVTTALGPSQWTDVKLVWQASGQMALSFNDIPVLNQSVFGSKSSSLTFSVGASSAGAVNEPRSFRYDNVEIKLQRAP